MHSLTWRSMQIDRLDENYFMRSVKMPIKILFGPKVSIGQDFLSCPASYLRPGGRQDRTKIKDASCPTGQDRTPGPPVLCSALVRTKTSQFFKIIRFFVYHI